MVARRDSPAGCLRRRSVPCKQAPSRATRVCVWRIGLSSKRPSPTKTSPGASEKAFKTADGTQRAGTRADTQVAAVPGRAPRLRCLEGSQHPAASSSAWIRRRDTSRRNLSLKSRRASRSSQHKQHMRARALVHARACALACTRGRMWHGGTKKGLTPRNLQQK